jgi:hypothetical protein
MKSSRFVPATGLSLWLLLAVVPLSAAELPYVAQARSGTAAGGAPRLVVETSAKLELVTLVAALADSSRTVNQARPDNPLGGFWNTQTAPFGAEDAPRHLRELRSFGLWGDRLLEFSLHLSDPPALERVVPWSEALLAVTRRAGAEDPAAELDKLRQEIQSFGERIRFMEHLEQRRDDYASVVSQLKDLMGGTDPMEVNQAFWGVPPAGDVYLIPSPLLAGGYMAELELKETRPQFLAFGPALAEDVVDPHLFHHLVYHELGHTLVDPMLTRASGTLASSDALWLPLSRELGEARFVTTWPQGIGEHLLRAYNIYLLRKHEPVVAELLVTTETLSGYIYTRLFLEILNEYAANRDRWPSFEAYMPTFAERLKAEAGNVRELDPETRAPDFQLANPGFEAAGNGWMATSWDMFPAGALAGRVGGIFSKIARDDQVAHEGKASLRLEVAPDTTALAAMEQGPLAIRAGGTVKISAWVKAQDVRREGVQQKVCGIYILFLNAKGEVLSRGESDSAIGTLDWTHLSGEFLAPAETARAQFGILLGMSGTAWFDDLTFERID